MSFTQKLIRTQFNMANGQLEGGRQCLFGARFGWHAHIVNTGGAKQALYAPLAIAVGSGAIACRFAQSQTCHEERSHGYGNQQPQIQWRDGKVDNMPAPHGPTTYIRHRY